MKKLTQRQALLFAFIASCVSILTTLGIAFAFRTALSGKQSQLTESRNVNGETVIQGRRVFMKHCAECHGFDARGDEGSNLRKLGAGDALIRQIITGGIKGEMPAYGKVLSEADVRIDSLSAHAAKLTLPAYSFRSNRAMIGGDGWRRI